MARENLDAWIPEERGSAVLTTISANSAVEALGRPEPMASDTKEVPRVGDVDVTVTPKGTAYTENSSTDDVVTLRARKFTGLLRIADEDLQDIPENVIALKQTAWASAYAKGFDNACLGVTAAENGTTVPFTSVYRTLSQADAALGYTANANIVKTAAGAAVSYDNLSAVLSLVENGDFYGDLVVVAHPSFKGRFRGIKNDNGNPIFVQGLGDAGQDMLFGLPVAWSQGARTSATFTAAPTGNPILVVANRDLLIKGVRSGPEFAAVNGFTGASALTDEALVKARSRRGFALGHPGGAAILEAVAAA